MRTADTYPALPATGTAQGGQQPGSISPDAVALDVAGPRGSVLGGQPAASQPSAMHPTACHSQNLSTATGPSPCSTPFAAAAFNAEAACERGSNVTAAGAGAAKVAIANALERTSRQRLADHAETYPTPVAVLALGAAPGSSLTAPPSWRVLSTAPTTNGPLRDAAGHAPRDTASARCPSDGAVASAPGAAWLTAAAAVAAAGDRCPFTTTWVNASAREHLLLEAADEYDSVIAQMCERDPALRVLLKQLGRQMVAEGPGAGGPVTHMVPGGVFGPSQRASGNARAGGRPGAPAWALGRTDSFGGGGSGGGALPHGFSALRLTPCLVRLPLSAVAPSCGWVASPSGLGAESGAPSLRPRSSAPGFGATTAAASTRAAAAPATTPVERRPLQWLLNLSSRSRACNKAATDPEDDVEANGEPEQEVEQPGLLVEHLGGDQLTAAVPELYERLQRDCSILSGVSAIITLLDLHGCVLHQNALSVDYMGYHRQPAAPSGGSAAAARSAAAYLASVAAGSGAIGSGSTLEKLFQLDPGKLPEMLAAVLDGRTWTGIVRMPPHLLGDGEEPGAGREVDRSQMAMLETAARGSRLSNSGVTGGDSFWTTARDSMCGDGNDEKDTGAYSSLSDDEPVRLLAPPVRARTKGPLEKQDSGTDGSSTEAGDRSARQTDSGGGASYGPAQGPQHGLSMPTGQASESGRTGRSTRKSRLGLVPGQASCNPVSVTRAAEAVLSRNSNHQPAARLSQNQLTRLTPGSLAVPECRADDAATGPASGQSISPATASPGPIPFLRRSTLGSCSRADASAAAYLQTAEDVGAQTNDGEGAHGGSAGGGGAAAVGTTSASAGGNGGDGGRLREGSSSRPETLSSPSGSGALTPGVAAATQRASGSGAVGRGGGGGTSTLGRRSTAGSLLGAALSPSGVVRGSTPDGSGKPKGGRSSKAGFDLQAMNTSSWALVGNRAPSPNGPRRPATPGSGSSISSAGRLSGFGSGGLPPAAAHRHASQSFSLGGPLPGAGWRSEPPAWAGSSGSGSFTAAGMGGGEAGAALPRVVFFAAAVRRKSMTLQQQQQQQRRRASALAPSTSQEVSTRRSLDEYPAPGAHPPASPFRAPIMSSDHGDRALDVGASAGRSAGSTPFGQQLRPQQQQQQQEEPQPGVLGHGSQSGGPHHGPSSLASGGSGSAAPSVSAAGMVREGKRSGRFRVRPLLRRVGLSASSRFGSLPDGGVSGAGEEEEEYADGVPTQAADDGARQINLEQGVAAALAEGGAEAGAAAQGDRGIGAVAESEASAGGDEDQEQEDEEGEEGEGARWHEVSARPFRDPVTRRRCILLMQMDVTAKVETERRLAELIDAEHKILEQIFPRHVLEHMAIDNARAAARPACAFHAFRRDCNQLATKHEAVTILFADIKGFTNMCKDVEPEVVMTFLNDLYNRFDTLLDVYGVYKVETIGDCYMVAGGLIRRDAEGFTSVCGPGAVDPLHAVRVMSFAKAMLREAGKLRMPLTGDPLMVRVGIHSGPVMSGVVGTRMPRFCLFGDTVNTASRMESTAEPGTIHVSGDTQQLLTGEWWAPSGGVEVKGKGLMHTFVWLGNDTETAPRLPKEAGGAGAQAAAMRLGLHPMRCSTAPRHLTPGSAHADARGGSGGNAAAPGSGLRCAKRSATAPRELRRNALSITLHSRLGRVNAARGYERKASTLGQLFRRGRNGSDGGASVAADGGVGAALEVESVVEETEAEVEEAEGAGNDVDAQAEAEGEGMRTRY